MDKCCGFFKRLFSLPSASIDNPVFKLHYRVTFWILIVFSIIIGCLQLFGEPIHCTARDLVSRRSLDTFCWVHATFTLEEAYQKKEGPYSSVLYPGVDKHTLGEARIYHSSYQWVCYVLFLQALMFYAPRYFWKSMEKGRIESLMMNLQKHGFDENKERANVAILVKYFIGFHNSNRYYSFYYMFSEILNAVNVIGQMFLMDAFLGGAFLTFGIEIIKHSDWNWDWVSRYDPLYKLFPRVTKCSFYSFGSSGFVQRLDATCNLLMNNINEKVYVFLWFWLVILSVLSCSAVVYRAVLYSSRKMRVKALTMKGYLVESENAKRMVGELEMGDWFLINLLAKNIHSMHFRDFIFQLNQRSEQRAQIEEEVTRV